MTAELPEHLQEVDNYWPLKDISERTGVSEDQLRRWAESKRENGFPKPRKVGKFTFYDVEAVEQWIYLMRRATARFNGGNRINGQR